MANLKAACLKKGVVIGRMSQALNELHIQHDVLDNADLELSRGALGELKDSIRPLKKNFKTSLEEVARIESGVKIVTNLLRGQPKEEDFDAVKQELRQIRENFRKAVGRGFGECRGTQIMSIYDINHFVNDNAFYSDTHPDPKPQ